MGWPKALDESSNLLRNKNGGEAKKHESSNYETVENVSQAESHYCTVIKDERRGVSKTFDEHQRCLPYCPQQNETQAGKSLEDGADKGPGAQIYDEHTNQMQNTDALKSARAM